MTVRVKLLSRVQLSATPWTVAYQALQSMGFSRQRYWSGLPLPSPLNVFKGHKQNLDIYPTLKKKKNTCNKNNDKNLQVSFI